MWADVTGGLSVEVTGSSGGLQLSTVCDPNLVRIVEVRGHQKKLQLHR